MERPLSHLGHFHISDVREWSLSMTSTVAEDFPMEHDIFSVGNVGV